MKTKHLFWGMLFLSLGTLLLINNFSSIHYNWSNFVNLWPVVFILWGVAIIVNNKIVKSFIAALAGLVLALSLFSLGKSSINFIDGQCIYDSDISSVEFEGSTHQTDFTEEFTPSIKKAALNLDAGAGRYEINDTTAYLFSAHNEGSNDNYILNRTDNEDETVLNMKMTRKRIFFNHGRIKNKMFIRLNTQPVWDLDFDLGAASLNFDLSPYKTKNISIDMGAASLKLKLGSLSDYTECKIDAGASSIEILIPESSGCEIKTDVSLSSKHFDDFKRINSDLYRTDNYDSAKNKIDIYIDSAVSSIKVRRYNTDW